MNKQPNFPFDITGYTCFSVINCPIEQAIQLLKEYPGLCAPEDRVPFCPAVPKTLFIKIENGV